MVNRVAGLVALLAVVAGLGGCGFHMRGATDLPQDFREIYVEAPISMVDEIEVFVESGGGRLVGDRAVADGSITVRSERYNRRVIAVDPVTGKEREFELLYIVNFDARLKDGTDLVAPQDLVVRRNYIFDETAVLGASREETVLRDEMRRDAAQRIVRIVSASLGG